MADRPARMSVEQPLWRALTGYRILTLCYALGLFALAYGDYGRPVVGLVYMGLLTGWTVLTLRSVSAAERCSWRFLAMDITVAVAGILLSPLADPYSVVGPTLPSIWVAGAVLALAVKGGWRWAAVGSAMVGVANIIENGGLARSTVHNVLLVCVASVAIGYVVEVARASERTLARALRIDAATRERERLARDIHDGVLQVLAMVQRRGTAIGGEAAELGRLAGEQERALRTLVMGLPSVRDEPAAQVTSGWRVPVPAGLSRRGVPGARFPTEDAVAKAAPGDDASAVEVAAEQDLRALLAACSGDGVTFAGPGSPVPLPAATCGELAAAVAAALDNVRRHAGGRAWILLEDEPDEVLVTVRDEGPGITEGRLAAAESEGRLGAALSIRGRLRELGGTAVWVSVPGQGTEVELRLPRQRVGRKGKDR